MGANVKPGEASFWRGQPPDCAHGGAHGIVTGRFDLQSVYALRDLEDVFLQFPGRPRRLVRGNIDESGCRRGNSLAQKCCIS